MASDYLLKIDGIKGESTDAKHKDEIEIESFSWGATQPGSFATAGGGGAGKVSFQDLHFTTRVNVASPNLMVACATGQHIKVGDTHRAQGRKGAAGVLHRQASATMLVSSFQSGGSEGSNALPVNQFSLNFAKIEFESKSQKPDGTLGAPVKGG